MSGILFEDEPISQAERATRARGIAEANRKAALERASRPGTAEQRAKLENAVRIAGKVLDDRVVQPGGYYCEVMTAGELLRIVDLEGLQAVDFLCYDALDRTNRYNAANTIKMARSIFLGAGVRLYSDKADHLMTIVGDTVGWHDTIGGCCSAEVNRLRYGVEDTPSCHANFVAALKRHGMDARDIPANVNFFMCVPIERDGTTAISDGRSGPGDYVELRAERDVLVAASNCPQMYNEANGWNPTPVRIMRWR